MTAFGEFPSTTPQLGLPLLFVGQSQKEFFVNQSLAVLDALASRTIVASLASPPADPHEGDCFRVVAPAVDGWADREDCLALRVGGDWHFIAPQQGMMIHDASQKQCLHFDSSWHSASLPAGATGGASIDAEARALLAQVIDALAKLGLVATQPA
ncbi:MAG: DUF2793 domain-containing protein [Erythrobacter sp.]